MKIGGRVHTPSDNQTWLIDAGDAVIQKKATTGPESLSSWEKLIYCLWVADYGMRNAGDLETARNLYRDFQQDAARLSKELHLEFTHETFALDADVPPQQYFERFDRICNEVANA